MHELVIDFETKDPYIGDGLGSGWVYSIVSPTTNRFSVLGAALMSVIDGVQGSPEYVTDRDTIVERVAKADRLIMHNSSYDYGCLLSLYVEPKNTDIVDTEVMGRLHCSSLTSHSLDALAHKYLHVRKKNSVLVNFMWDSGLYAEIKVRQLYGRPAYRNKQPATHDDWLTLIAEYRYKLIAKYPDVTANKKLVDDILNVCKCNMDKVQEKSTSVMAEYAIGDISVTYDLYKFFMGNGADLGLCIKYSNMAKMLCESRRRGVRVDLHKAEENHRKLVPIIAQKYKEVFDIAGEEFNLASIKDKARVFDRLGIKYGNTPKGNPNIDSKFLESHDHPICQAIVEAKKVQKIDKDFIMSLVNIQDNFSNEDYAYGRVFPELNLLRARTGRFSCSSPNIQQIPARDEVYGPMCRELYIAEEGDSWYSLDYSNQEGRLQVHYAVGMEAEGANVIMWEFERDPWFDVHGLVAETMEVTRGEAKGINFGISYCMGLKTMAKNMRLSVEQASILRDKYDSMFPFLSQLNERCSSTLRDRGYIKTIGGRKSHIDAPTWDPDKEKMKTFEYKALNKLIQGSAADQIMLALWQCYKEGVYILFPVHDQICFSGTIGECERVRDIMENVIKLCIPVKVDYNKHEAKNWAEAGH